MKNSVKVVLFAVKSRVVTQFLLRHANLVEFILGEAFTDSLIISQFQENLLTMLISFFKRAFLAKTSRSYIKIGQLSDGRGCKETFQGVLNVFGLGYWDLGSWQHKGRCFLFAIQAHMTYFLKHGKPSQASYKCADPSYRKEAFGRPHLQNIYALVMVVPYIVKTI